MIRQYIRHLLTLALAGTLLLAGTAQAKIVCWTNSDGVRECGNAVPPEYAQQETRTLDNRGITTEIKERARTPEELAAERTRRAEEERLAAEEEKRHQAQEAHDQVLLSTYLNEEDILRSRERQSSAINATIEVTRAAVGKLQEKLNDERKRAASFERQGRPLPERLQEDIDSLQEQIDAKNSYTLLKEQEKSLLHEKYEADMVRFRELKANGARLR
jgi:hypothetical protein